MDDNKMIWKYKILLVLAHSTKIFFLNYCQMLYNFKPQCNKIKTQLDVKQTAGEEARRQLHKNAARNIEQVLAATPHNTATYLPSRKLSKLDEQDMHDTAGEAGTSS